MSPSEPMQWTRRRPTHVVMTAVLSLACSAHRLDVRTPPLAAGPPPPSPLRPGVRAFAMGHNDQGCALMWSGGVWCWGSAGLGARWQDRDANPIARVVAEAIPLASGAVAIAVAPSFGACARLDDGGVTCWGAAIPGAVPTTVGGSCWGNECAEIAYRLPRFWDHREGEDRVTIAPFDVPEARGAMTIALDDPGYPPAPVLRAAFAHGPTRCIGSGWEHEVPWEDSCRLAERPSRPDLGPPLRCTLGIEIGLGCYVTHAVDRFAEGARITVTGIRFVHSVSCGRWGICAVRGDRHVSCWQLPSSVDQTPDHGARPTVTAAETTASEVAGLDDVGQVEVSNRIACALRSNGALWCWDVLSPDRPPWRLDVPVPP